MNNLRMFGLKTQDIGRPWHLAQDERLAWCGVAAQYRHHWVDVVDTSGVTCSRCLRAIKAGQPRAWRS